MLGLGKGLLLRFLHRRAHAVSDKGEQNQKRPFEGNRFFGFLVVGKPKGDGKQDNACDQRPANGFFQKQDPVKAGNEQRVGNEKRGQCQGAVLDGKHHKQGGGGICQRKGGGGDELLGTKRPILIGRYEKEHGKQRDQTAEEISAAGATAGIDLFENILSGAGQHDNEQ